MNLRIGVLTAVAIALLVLAPTRAEAQELSSASKNFVRNAGINLKDLNVDPSLCVSNFSLDKKSAARSLQSKIDSKTGYVTRPAKKVPQAERSHPEVAPMLAKLDTLVQCSAKIKVGLDALKSVEEAMKFVKNYDGNYKGVQPVAALCSGSFSLENHSAAVNLLMAIERGMYFVKRSSKGLSAEARKHPEAAKRLTTFAAFVACEPMLKKGIKANKAAMEARKKRHFAFMKAGSDYSRTVTSLIAFVDHPNDAIRSTPDPAQLTKWKTDLQAVHALCTGKYTKVVNDPRYGHSNERNPEKWCALGAMHKHVIESVALNYARSGVEFYTKGIREQVDEFEKYDGYLRLDQREALFNPAEAKANMIKRHEPILSVAGITRPKTLFVDFDKSVKDLWAKINAKGPTWKAPKKQGAGPGANAAKKRFKGKGSSVKKAYITRNDWQIIKNAIGIPLRRTKPGYVIYQVSGDKKNAGKLCRGRSFTYAEEYTGRKYAKSTEVKELGYIRFEPCR